MHSISIYIFPLLIARRHVSVICFYKSAHVTLKMKIRIKRERNKLVLGKCPWKRWKWLKLILTVCVGYFTLYYKKINFKHQPPYIYFDIYNAHKYKLINENVIYTLDTQTIRYTTCTLICTSYNLDLFWNREPLLNEILAPTTSTFLPGNKEEKCKWFQETLKSIVRGLCLMAWLKVKREWMNGWMNEKSLQRSFNW